MTNTSSYITIIVVLVILFILIRSPSSSSRRRISEGLLTQSSVSPTSSEQMVSRSSRRATSRRSSMSSSATTSSSSLRSTTRATTTTSRRSNGVRGTGRYYGNNVVAVLELGDSPVDEDFSAAVSLEYVMVREGFPVEIVNGGGGLDNYINQLETWYRRGTRIFIGFSRSDLLAGVLPWFEQHPDAIGISMYSTATSLSIPKPIIRLTPSDDLLVTFLSSFIAERYTSYLILYDQDEIVSTDLFRLLSNSLPADRTIASPAQPDVNPQEIVQLISQLGEGSVIIPLYLSDRGGFRDLLTQSFTSVPDIIDPIGVFPLFSYEGQTLFNGKYYTIAFRNQLALALREMETTLSNNFVVNAYDAVSIARDLIQVRPDNPYTHIDHMLGFNGLLELNTNNDRRFGTYVPYVFANRRWVPQFIWSFTPELGRYEAAITQAVQNEAGGSAT